MKGTNFILFEDFPLLARSAPVLLEGVGGPRQLLEQLDSIMDTEVGKLDPGAHPARFTFPPEPAAGIMEAGRG